MSFITISHHNYDEATPTQIEVNKVNLKTRGPFLEAPGNYRAR